MYGFARKPIWIFGHLLTLTALAAFITAGLWQLSRHYEQREQNEAVRDREAASALTAAELLSEIASDPEALGELTWRMAEVSGTWSHDDAVLIRNRSQTGFSGCYLALPLKLETLSSSSSGDTGESAVLVVAGWLQSATCIDVTTASKQAEQTELTALTALANELLPSEPVSLLGRVRQTQTRALFGPTDPPNGRLISLARVDVERIDAQTPQTLAPSYLELVTATPVLTNLEPVNPPETDAGPHLGYTFQYFAFAVIAFVGYPLVIVRYARRQDGLTNDF